MRCDDHPADCDLDDFVLGKLDGAAETVIEAHLASCPRCVARAAEARHDTLTALLRVASHEGEVADAPAVSPPTLAYASTAQDAWPAPAPPPELAGHAKYRLVRLLGHGGMGEVWLCEHLVMNRKVAVKVIRPQLLPHDGSISRFLREVQAVARLNHPHIVTAHDAEAAGDSHLLVLEYVEGRTLAEELAGGPLPVRDACRAVREAALGLAAAHAAGLVHRDVKPANLIRDPDGVVKILDFGLAGIGGEDQLTGQSMLVGTPDYIAPEQADDPRTADARADIYSLGATLFHLLSGRVLFPSRSLFRKLDAQRGERPPSVPGLPPCLDAALNRMLAKRPEERYQTADEVAAALEPFTRPPAPRPRAAWRWAVAALGVLAVAAVGGVLAHHIVTDTGEILIETEDPDVEVTVKRGGRVVAIHDPKTRQSLVLRSGVYELEVGKASGLALDVERATLKRGEKVVARVTRLPGARHDGNSLVLEGHVMRVRRVMFSADGATLYSCSDDGTVRAWDAVTGRQTARFFTGYRTFAIALAQKQTLLVASTEWGMRCWDVKTGREVRRFRVMKLEQRINQIATNPDGTKLVTGSDDGMARIWDVVTGAIEKEWSAPLTPGPCYTVAWSADGKKVAAGNDRTVSVLDVPGGTIFRSERFVEGLLGVNFHPDGPLGTIIWGGRVAVYEGNPVKPVATLDGGHEGHSFAARMTFTPGGQLVVGGRGNYVDVWDWRGGRRLATLAGHEAQVIAVAVSPDGKRIATGSEDRAVRLWQWPAIMP